jgi:hypothetical protein
VVERLLPHDDDGNPSNRYGEPQGTELPNLCPDNISEAPEIVVEGLCADRQCFTFLRHGGFRL